MTRSRTWRTALVAAIAAATLAMSACSAHPGSAAVVGSETITTAALDDVALALCAAQGGGTQNPGQPQQLASRAARQGALKVMIDSELSNQFGRSEGVEPSQEQVSAALASNEQAIAALPAEHRVVFKKTLKQFAEGQLMLIDIGRRELAKSGQQNVTEQQAVSEGTKLRNAWAAKHADVSVDPRYGTYVKNNLEAASGSLSVAASTAAEDGSSPDPSAGWVASLPASQKCS